jgi:hypothetical protein
MRFSYKYPIENFNFRFNVEEDRQFFTEKEKIEISNWEAKMDEEDRQYEENGIPNVRTAMGLWRGENPHKSITKSYCKECALVVKKIKIESSGGFSVDSVEKLEAKIVKLEKSLSRLEATIQLKNDRIIELITENNKLLSKSLLVQKGYVIS